MLFERGIDAYEQLELAAASSAFAAAAGQDPRNPVPLLWRGRMAALMRQDQDALQAADQAERLVTDETRARDRVLIEAVHAELRRDLTSAAERYQRMVARYPDEPSWLLELAAFHDRRGASAEAVETYHRALSLDSRLLTAHLELCRLYSPSALNEPALAKEHGELMLKMSRELRNRGGEAQALMCLTDVLRTGRQDEIKEARRSAEEALSIMEALKYPFGTARASNYVAIVALLAERDATRAVPLLERTLTAARSVGFVFLESRVRMNLGVADEMLGRRLSAWKNFKASFALAEALGNQQGAAWSQINAAQMVIDYGGEPRDALRDAQNALGVFQQLHDKDFEVHARRVIASYHRHRGEFEDAERQLTLGLDVARQRDLDEKVTRLTLELARVRFDQGHYTQARELIEQASKRATGLDSINANLQLARVLTRLGDFSSARARLDGVEAQIKRSGDSSLPPVFLARGELEYEMGRIPQAREQFRQASALWTGDEFPDDATVEARAYHGFLEGLEGEPARGVSTLVESLTQGRKSERLTLEARCLVFLARVVLNRGNAAEAARRLREITEERRARLSPELQAQIRYWSGQALAKQGDANAAAGEIAGARALNDAWRQSLGSPEYQASVLLRPDIRLIQSDGAAVRP
jgi:tetratricopeptide (TPR) repeat protein